jgi:hypothetical protein
MSLANIVAAANLKRRGLRPIRRVLFSLLPVLVALPLALTFGVAPAYSWVSDTWISSVTLFGTIPETNVGTDDATTRVYIEAWRPVGTDVTLCYLDPVENTWTCDSSNNASDNPVKWNEGDDNDVMAFCENFSPSNVNPFTCQTTEPMGG